MKAEFGRAWQLEDKISLLKIFSDFLVRADNVSNLSKKLSRGLTPELGIFKWRLK